MSVKYNFTGLKNIYLEALIRADPTLVFEIVQGRGRFVFMMFFSSEDKESKDRLFIQLRNTKVFLELKVYGSHRNGDFLIYLDDSNQQKIINELQLEKSGEGFFFDNFLSQLNQQIPIKLTLQTKLVKVREVWPEVGHRLSSVVDEADKNILMGIKKLPEGKKPQDKTLRKLYIYTNGHADVITNLISSLKAARVTLAWTHRQDVAEKSLSEIMAMINS